MKLFKKVVGILTVLSMLCSLMPIAFADGSGTGYIYENAFDTAEKVNELTRVSSGKLPGSPTMAYSADKGTMYFEGWGQNAGFLFPESVTASDFVAEGDFIYEKKSDYRNRSIGYGFIFGYQSDTDFSKIVYYPLTGDVTLSNAKDGSESSRNAEKGAGAGITAADNEVVHLKLVLNDGQMEFFANDELCYTYYSKGTTTGPLSPARDFTTSGRLGFFCNADKTMLTLKNLTVRQLKYTDDVYYTNTFMGSPTEDGTTLKSLANLSEYFKDKNALTGGTWGALNSYEYNFESVGRYIEPKLTGNYSADINFAFLQPQEATASFSFMLGYDDEYDEFILAKVKLNGSISIEQKEIVADNAEQKISDSAADYKSYATTISDAKKDKTEKEEDDGYIVSYMPKGYTSSSYEDVLPRRHNLHLEVVDGVVSVTFEGQTASLKPDVVSTDGYFGYVLNGSAASIYSLRVGKLPSSTEITEDYTEIGSSKTSSDIIISDPENNLTSDSKIILAVYNDGVLIGVKNASPSEKDEDGKLSLEASYTSLSDTTKVTAVVYCWSLDNLTPIISTLPVGLGD